MKPLNPTEDIRRARHKLAAQFDNDLERIVADLRRQQHDAGRVYVTLTPRPPTGTSRRIMGYMQAAANAAHELCHRFGRPVLRLCERGPVFAVALPKE